MSSSILVAPRTGWVVAWIGLFIVFGIAFLATFGRYTQHVTAVGQLVPSQGLFTLNATGAGSLVALHMHEGQRVRQGEVLVEVSGELDRGAQRYRLDPCNTTTDAEFMKSEAFHEWSERRASNDDERFITFV